jgi:hypothetical protein
VNGAGQDDLAGNLGFNEAVSNALRVDAFDFDMGPQALLDILRFENSKFVPDLSTGLGGGVLNRRPTSSSLSKPAGLLSRMALAAQLALMSRISLEFPGSTNGLSSNDPDARSKTTTFSLVLDCSE